MILNAIIERVRAATTEERKNNTESIQIHIIFDGWLRPRHRIGDGHYFVVFIEWDVPQLIVVAGRPMRNSVARAAHATVECAN